MFDVYAKRIQAVHLTEDMRQNVGKSHWSDCWIAHRCYINHHMEVHSKKKALLCSVYPYSTKNKATINLHMWNPIGEHTQLCQLCDLKCKNVSHLKQHTNTTGIAFV